MILMDLSVLFTPEIFAIFISFSAIVVVVFGLFELAVLLIKNEFWLWVIHIILIAVMVIAFTVVLAVYSDRIVLGIVLGTVVLPVALAISFEIADKISKGELSNFLFINRK